MRTESKPGTVDEYIDSAPEQLRGRLEELRALARSATPATTEALKWGTPAFLHPSGTILFIISGHQRHSNVVFTPSIREAFEDELSDVETGKGSVKIPHSDPVPRELLRRMMQARWREFEDHGVTWR
ncbi:DUF1801 domain-containing protein [Citricoccus sp.]|uniref:iron chaperone n=1 Tax=Citricoccus sp. TaxID=1978372 RepID=UPI0028BE7C2D|nr:DUF1801 domain-containing protein [Citricoccus sp.]